MPPVLQKGDKVAFIATARKMDADVISKAKALVSQWGLTVVEGENLRKEDHQFAGSDLQRAADLQWAINDSEINAIICFRGGYGSVRILEKVDFSMLQHNPKWICGYSDVTALHNVIHNLNVTSLHSTMPVNFESNSKESIETFKNALFGIDQAIFFEGHELNRVGQAKAPVVGGNLSMLYSLRGTKHDLPTKGKILFLEDLDEYLYHVDRMMQNLKLGGMLHGLKGLIVGGMTEMNDNSIPFGKTAVEIIKEAVSPYNYPVCFGAPIGHMDDNRTLKLGAMLNMEVADNVKIWQ